MFIPASTMRVALVWRQVWNTKFWSSSRPIRFFVRSHHDLRSRLDGIVSQLPNSASRAAVSCDMGPLLVVSVCVFHRWRRLPLYLTSSNVQSCVPGQRVHVATFHNCPTLSA